MAGHQNDRHRVYKKKKKQCTYHIDTRSRAFRRGTERTGFAVGADGPAPGASVFLGSGNAEGAVGVVAMRSEDIALVQSDGQGADVMIPVPDDRHLGFVFANVGFVRILQWWNAKEERE